MGVETLLDLSQFEPRKYKKIRRWLNTAKNANVSVHETRRTPEVLQTLGCISDEWLQGKVNSSEMRLLTRPLILEEEPLTRVFTGQQDGQTIGFTIFDPIMSDDKVIGYYANLSRARNGAPNGTLDAVLAHAMAVFKTEGGLTQVSLGLSPLHEMPQELGLGHPLTQQILKTTHDYGERVYAFKGLAAHKDAYARNPGAQNKQTYFTSAATVPAVAVLKAMQAIGIIPPGNTLKVSAFLGSQYVKEYLAQRRKHD